MNNKTAGWALGLSALAMMLMLISADVKELNSFHDALRPSFVADMMAHIANIIMAFIGGKLIPTEPGQRLSDRVSDKKLQDINNTGANS